MRENLTSFYAEQYDELNRLSKDQAHSIEYITTLHFLRKHLPRGCSVLDCCAGCGVYAFPLAADGYRVTAGDLVEEHVAAINAANTTGLLEHVYQGDVLDMSRFAKGTFDAVLCLGAFYHLFESEERERCVAECLRVLKPGGIFVFAYISRNAVYINHFMYNRSEIEARAEILKTGKNGVFYCMDFSEQKALAARFPVEEITDVGIDGLIYPLREALNSADADEFNAYMEYHLATCEQPSILGHSIHGLWIGRKK